MANGLNLAEALERLSVVKRDVLAALPGQVEEIVLFGSRARGDAIDGSDYDIAILLSGSLADDRSVRRKVADVTWDHQSDIMPIQAVVLNARILRQPAGPGSELAARIASEGVTVP